MVVEILKNMKHYKINPSTGSAFEKVVLQAQETAKEKKVIVEFEFNGITCLVSQRTKLDLLLRDYQNAFIMDWEFVGPVCMSKYSPEVLKELKRRTKIKAEERKRRVIEYRKEQEKEKAVFAEKVRGISIKLKNSETWEKIKETNTDPYGKCTVEYAEGWARLMQAEMSKGATLEECAKKTSFELGFLGITGFMYGCAVGILSECWEYGDDLRRWHNKKYNHEGEGVVNPAILTIQTS